MATHGDIMVLEMRQQAFEMVDAERAAHALQRLSRTLHDVLNEQLAAAAEQIGERHPALRRIEFVALVDLDPGQGPALLGERVAPAGEFLFFLHELPAFGDPLFTSDDAMHGKLLQRLRLPIGRLGEQQFDIPMQVIEASAATARSCCALAMTKAPWMTAWMCRASDSARRFGTGCSRSASSIIARNMAR